MFLLNQKGQEMSFGGGFLALRTGLASLYNRRRRKSSGRLAFCGKIFTGKRAALCTNGEGGRRSIEKKYTKLGEKMKIGVDKSRKMDYNKRG